MTDYPPADDRLRHLLAQEINTRVETWRLAFTIAGFIVDSTEVRAEIDRIGSAHAAGQPCGDRNCPRCFQAQLDDEARAAARQAAGQPAADERVAELEAEIVRLHEKHKASLRHADQVTNELREEVQRYADGTERPVLWSVYNQMHNRALAAEAKLTATPAAGLAAPTNHDTETERPTAVDSARVRIINHRGVFATADTEIAALLDEYRSEILNSAADRFAAFDRPEEARMLRRLAAGAES